MKFAELILVIVVCFGLSLFVAYKMLLFFSDENEKANTRKGKAKRFFQNKMKENEKERRLHNDQFNWEVFKTKMQAHLLPAAIAALLVVVILNTMANRQATKTVQASNFPPPTTSQPAKPQQIEPESITQLGIQPEAETEITSWTDSKGQRHYTNTANAEPEQPNSRETQVLIDNNQILVPVVIGHRGQAIQAYFLLDTGCSKTLFHHTIAERIQPDITKKGSTTIADGRKIDTQFCRVDFIQVGPYTERNFEASTYYVEGKEKYHGLLGMAFLEKHPFQIDMQRKVIRWM